MPCIENYRPFKFKMVLSAAEQRDPLRPAADPILAWHQQLQYFPSHPITSLDYQDRSIVEDQGVFPDYIRSMVSERSILEARLGTIQDRLDELKRASSALEAYQLQRLDAMGVLVTPMEECSNRLLPFKEFPKMKQTASRALMMPSADLVDAIIRAKQQRLAVDAQAKSGPLLFAEYNEAINSMTDALIVGIRKQLSTSGGTAGMHLSSRQNLLLAQQLAAQLDVLQGIASEQVLEGIAIEYIGSRIEALESIMDIGATATPQDRSLDHIRDLFQCEEEACKLLSIPASQQKLLFEYLGNNILPKKIAPIGQCECRTDLMAAPSLAPHTEYYRAWLAHLQAK